MRCKTVAGLCVHRLMLVAVPRLVRHPLRALVLAVALAGACNFALRPAQLLPTAPILPPPRGLAGPVLMVTEVVPGTRDGGSLRALEFLTRAAAAFGRRPWLLVRSPWSRDHADGAALLRHNVRLVGEREAGLTPTFEAPTGKPADVDDFAALVGRAGAPFGMAVLALWSYHVAPSGDPHLTIPERCAGRALARNASPGPWRGALAGPWRGALALGPGAGRWPWPLAPTSTPAAAPAPTPRPRPWPPLTRARPDTLSPPHNPFAQVHAAAARARGRHVRRRAVG